MDPERITSSLILGDDFDYLLFKVAIDFAEQGLTVWLISSKSFKEIPKGIKPPNKKILQLITFVYLKDFKDLLTHLNGIHLWHKLPNLIVVKDFEVYTKLNEDNYNPLQAALIATTLLDSISTCAFKKNLKAFLLISVKSESISNKLQILKDLYFPNVIFKSSEEKTFDEIKKLFNDYNSNFNLSK